jgi:hypothetical protein
MRPRLFWEQWLWCLRKSLDGSDAIKPANAVALGDRGITSSIVFSAFFLTPASLK